MKGLALVVSFFTTSAYLRYFDNNAVLGAWFTIVSILNWIMVFDIGIGNGLRNKLVAAKTHHDDALCRSLISSSYALLAVPCILIAIVGGILVPALDWNTVLGVSSDLVAPGSLRLSVSIVLVGVVLQFWLKLIVSILYSEQKTALANLLTLFSSLALLLFVLFYDYGDLDDKLVAVSVANALFLNVPLALATVVLFSTTMKGVRPSFKYVQRGTSRSVISLGLTFFLIQIFLLVTNSTNEFLIGYLYSSEDVVDYQIYYRLFFTLVSIFTILVQPMWSALTQAYEDGNIAWMKKTYGKYNLISLLGALLACFILVFLEPIVDLWIGEGSIEVSRLNAFFVALWAVITLFNNSSACVENAVSGLKCQVIFCGLAAALKFPVAYVLSLRFSSWCSVIATNCLVLLPLLVAQLIDVRKFFSGRQDSQIK